MCETCSSGEYYNGVSSECKLCPKNTFTTSGAADINGCEACAEGGHSQPGTSYCDHCLSGKFYNQLSNNCELCPKNTFTISGARDINGCEACAEGGHSQPGARFCDQCLTAKYYDEISNECKLCPKNTFSITGANDISGCKPCANPGEYADVGSGYCKVCQQYMEFSETDQKCLCLDTFTRVGVEYGADGSCTCTFDNMKGSCIDVYEEVDNLTLSTTLGTLKIEPGYWRTGGTSIDVRECPVAEACVGGNGTDYCREGHDGPYCNLCADGFAKDPFLLCQSCNTTATSVVLSILFDLVLVGLLFGVGVLLKRNKAVYKRLKNGVKIISMGFQITASLPAVAPALPLPETSKEVVTTIQFFNADIFQLVSAGCISAGFNYFDRLLMVTLPIFLFCSALVLAGRKSKSNGSRFFDAAMAVLYLTLPTITTTVFGVFSCDTLDDERSMLRADYR
ncbi:hypothetical protein TL16_g12465 [Triparma laevis f. inornata]|uniref:Tyrosine-protein kinase ephrin type A/B receptor-like domain-containing protein n=1 Tax=Triparma laevis f. inornata TaxID=1714386 RepID=A0A9W7EW85_9STRA|nr:hypothetical protein TL16_g12465 [Triparma laevis f. inornata]